MWSKATCYMSHFCQILWFYETKVQRCALCKLWSNGETKSTTEVNRGDISTGNRWSHVSSAFDWRFLKFCMKTCMSLLPHLYCRRHHSYLQTHSAVVKRDSQWRCISRHIKTEYWLKVINSPHSGQKLKFSRSLFLAWSVICMDVKIVFFLHFFSTCFLQCFYVFIFWTL